MVFSSLTSMLCLNENVALLGDRPALTVVPPQRVTA
jgi:hypothetical protein